MNRELQMAVELEVRMTRQDRLAVLVRDTEAILYDILALSDAVPIIVLGPMRPGIAIPGPPLSSAEIESCVCGPGLSVILATSDAARVSLMIHEFFGTEYGEDEGVWATFNINPNRSAASLALMMAAAVACAQRMDQPILDEAGLLQNGRLVRPDVVVERVRLSSAGQGFAQAVRHVAHRLNIHWFDDEA